MSLANRPLSEFLDQLASKEPVPGGGSVSALSGALSASLLAMVCRLTMGKKGYEAVSNEMEGHLRDLLPLQQEFESLMQKDIEAYTQVMDAYKLPKVTDEEIEIRQAAVQNALKQATRVPLEVAELSAKLIEIARPIAEKGNRNASSDAGVAALMAETALRGAVFNVSINLSTLQDEAFASRCRNRVAELLIIAEKETRAILNLVQGRM